MGGKSNIDVTTLDDHQLARLEKKLKRQGTTRKQLEGGSADVDLSQLDRDDLIKLERRVKFEKGSRRSIFEKIHAGKVAEDEWRDVFDMPDFLRHADPVENKGCTYDFPFSPADYFRHSKISLRRKLARSKQDRKEILDEFFGAAVSDNLVVLQTFRLWMDRLYFDETSRFQDSFIASFGTLNSIKERKERHVMSLFEAMSRIESIPISIGKVGQMNVAGNQQVNNDLKKSPGAVIEAEGRDAT